MRSLAPIVGMFSAACLFACAGAQAAPPRVWNFSVFLDDSRIGYHRFTLREDGAERELTSEARFSVKVLFIDAYRYAHDATERWRGDCLRSLTSRTDDDGKRLAVETARDGERLTVAGAQSREVLGGCIMSYAYWNPGILRQSRLLNSQTGEYEPVKVAALGAETVTVRGKPVAASRVRISGPRHPIDLWYSGDDEWLALDAVLDGGRRLRYRLES